MKEDPIVAEVRAARERYAAQFDFDIDAIVDDVQKRQGQSGHPVVKAPPRRKAAVDQASTTDRPNR